MSETRFTAGPWTIERESEDDRPVIMGADGKAYVAELYTADDFPCFDEDNEEYEEGKAEMEANGDLICAAPDLYDALVDARAYVVGAYECAFPDDGENQRVLSAIDAALAKARGEAATP